jgi:hypothetical protein
MGHPIVNDTNDRKEPAKISRKDFTMTPPRIPSRDVITQYPSPALGHLSTTFGDLDRCSLKERQRILDWAMGELGGKLPRESKPVSKTLRTQLSFDDTGIWGHKSKVLLENKEMPAI